ncbi:hypothetical protein [Myxococcus landrumensis]|uniref:Lipoprotein n=1 Tax=Myxococcus landrumensis TaxID=2813577 RepID=A0ABX7MYD7_9BACT|nr:hypothetical protein [Myxococcus landrumus]QSQ11441.1 hypothetical protein JY572_23880 [Myxococcus landrumus]
MNLRLNWLWTGVAAAVVALTACSGGGTGADPGSLESSEAALCSVEQTCASGAPVTCSSATSACQSSPDNGGWVECDGVRTTCPPPCTCGTTQYTSKRYGEGAGCGAAMNQARTLLAETVAARCPAGSCLVSQDLGECVPLGPSRLDGFRATVSRTYTCKEPLNCR